MTDTRYLELPDGRRIAHRFTPGTGPTIVFLPGYMSDMSGSKATALFEMAQAAGRPCLLVDYSGCGESPGDFADGTLSRWRDEVLAVIAAAGLEQVVLVGSSMGGWLMLMVAEALAESGKVKGLVGIAAAPDFTEWGIAQMDKNMLADGETIWEDNPYGPEPTPTHPGFWADGQANLMLDREIAWDGPARLLHGQRDTDVPWDISVRLAERLRSADVQVMLIKDGDHRLSREPDIHLLLRTVAELVLARDPAA
ncbi:MAG: alpha/beta hydrolase [Novosphingobium lindaniclasticum]|jgi:pimeloyl-ACP methyl ester carboxylesterase|uniref:Palmitoyl-protein thioesterase ABHD10, mitochondrial n=1 Tax=Novosphingobium lindaniclasticum LE124 TaxID=1096930 RepID=T0I901_9SPHN|nr:alpha/beta fold hydrolase [Novosphingobium lindaniclasticum]EQB08155.1 alpha/beta hydrolase [Novosphingobium lindaniclasticum LE124]MDF2639993.1 alpha/beta hydrolase [Novosphingobium lindaniclasticum]